MHRFLTQTFQLNLFEGMSICWASGGPGTHMDPDDNIGVDHGGEMDRRLD